MFRFHRTARISRGKFPEAIQWAKEIAEFVNARYEPVSVQTYFELFGDVGTVHWFSDYEDLASVEKLNAQLLADQDYWGLINKGTDLFIEGSLGDTLMQSI